MVQTTDRQVALIIMTHRHADHIAGFARCADMFKTLTVGAVWMPIWESEYEPVAAQFQAELTRTGRTGLQTHFASFGAERFAGAGDSPQVHGERHRRAGRSRGGSVRFECQPRSIC